MGYYNEAGGHTPFERYFVGGDGVAAFQVDGRETIGLRGYENSRLTPLENGGGTMYSKYQLELRYSITDTPSASIYAVGFLEAGNSYDTFDEFKSVLETKTGFISAHWDGTNETEDKIKELTKATIRCIPLVTRQEEGVCMFSGKPSKHRVLFAKAY